jgi:hypothetical protein
MKNLTLVALGLLIGAGGWWLIRPAPIPKTAAVAPDKNLPARTPTAPPSPPADATTVAPQTAVPRSAVPESQRAVAPQKGPKPTLADLLQPGRRIHDVQAGLTVTYPEDWAPRDVALRWGVNEGENTIFFRAPEGSQAVPSLYYRKYSDGPAFDMANPEATLRDMALQKEVSRSAGGQNDYRNDPGSFVFRTIDGNPTLSYFATYTSRGEVQAEYFLRMLGPSGYVMFFNRGPVKDVQALIPTIVDMAGTVKPP